MEFNFILTQLLHQLGICKNYFGFDYIIFAIKRIDNDKDYLCYITKSLYIDIAKEFATSRECVEKNIRTVINKIWENSNLNEDTIIKIFGDFYFHHKPSNRDFLELLYDYTKSCRIIESSTNLTCPVTKEACPVYCKTVQKLL